MAWSATATATNKVVIEPQVSYTVNRGVVGVSVGVFGVLSETVTTERYKYVGMTESAAQTAANAINATANYQATARRAYEPAGYDVEVVYRAVTQAVTVI